MDDKKEQLPEYHKIFIRVKLPFGQAWIHKNIVEKIIK